MIDEWLLDPPTDDVRSMLLELLERRYDATSTVFCTQYAKKDWHQRLGSGVHADAIMDRIVHNTGDRPNKKKKAVAVRVGQVALPASEPVFVHGNAELVGHRIDVVDVDVDQGVRSSVALVLRQVDTGIASDHRDEPREAWFELVLPFLAEPEPLVPGDSPSSVFDVDDRHHFGFHDGTLTRCGRVNC